MNRLSNFLVIKRWYNRLNPERLTRRDPPNQQNTDGDRNWANYAYGQVVSPGTQGVPKSFILNVGGSRYLFNCGESTDRFLKENRMSTLYIRDILLTHLSWSTIGGVFALSRACHEDYRNFLMIHAPKGVDALLKKVNTIVGSGNVSLSVAKCNPMVPYETGAIKIRYVQLTDGSASSQDIDETGTGKLVPRLKTNICLNYICELKVFAERRLCVTKLVDFNVPPGPLVAKLRDGKSVTLGSGKIVTPDDVTLFTQDPWKIVIVVDCPSEGFLDSLLSENAYKNISTEGKILIVHFTCPAIMNDERYVSWMKRFPTGAVHLVINESSECTGLSMSKIKHEILRTIHPGIFRPLVGFSVCPEAGINKITFANIPTRARGIVGKVMTDFQSKEESQETPEYCSKKWKNMWTKNMQEFNLIESRTSTTFDLCCGTLLRGYEPWWKKSVTDSLMRAIGGASEEVNRLHKQFAKLGCDVSDREVAENRMNEEYPKVIFLGTSSVISSKYRNSSGILLKPSENKFVLLDCGEGTFLQLRLLYGWEGALDVLRNLNAVYVSHMHADHHLGLINILLTRKTFILNEGGTASKLLILGPDKLFDWLEFYDEKCESILENVEMIPLKDLLYNINTERTLALKKKLTDHLDLKEFVACRVAHCPNAFGVAVKHKDSWKITYSGDCTFSPSLVKIGKDSDLLIHEATFSSLLYAEAYNKNHSTIKDAVYCGEVMKAKHTILTHFSLRYNYIPDIFEIMALKKNNVSVAFDMMQVCLKDLPLLPLMHYAYSVCFAKELEKARSAQERSARNSVRIFPGFKGKFLKSMSKL